MILSARIFVSLRSEDVCRAVLEAIEPDNATVPSGITIRTTCIGSAMLIEIEGIDVSVLTFRNTIDDLLEHISIALKSIERIENSQRNKLLRSASAG